jgi:hypothetical protein
MSKNNREWKPPVKTETPVAAPLYTEPSYTRERIATACLNGLLANGRTGTIPSQLAEKAVRLADALIHALEAIPPGTE